MPLTRAEVDEMLRRADEQRRKLRRATRELASLGQQLVDARDTCSPASSLITTSSAVSKP